MIPKPVIKELTGKMSTSVGRVLKGQQENRIQTEPSVTDRLLANIERDFEDLSIPNLNIQLKATTLRGIAPGAPEHVYGADLATILNVDIGDYKINKGILAQSKLIKEATFNGVQITALTHPHTIKWEKKGIIEFKFQMQEFNRLKIQCDKMLEITPDSFVYLYCLDDIYVVSASAVAGISRTGTTIKLPCQNFKLFNSGYLESFIGDSRLKGTTKEDFDKLITETDSRKLLHLEISNNAPQPIKQ